MATEVVLFEEIQVKMRLSNGMQLFPPTSENFVYTVHGGKLPLFPCVLCALAVNS